MKLLDKKTVNTDLARDRKAQIDEGIKLATKVDVLRETVVKEEGNLQRFRTETVAAVQVEIDGYIRQKDNLKTEISVLEENKRVLEIPLTDKWADVHDAEAKLLKEKQVWVEKSDILKLREDEVEREERSVEMEKGKAIDLNHLASQNFARSESTLKSAHEEAADMRNRAQIVLSSAELRELAVKEKEEEVEKREIEVTLAWEHTRAKETDLAHRERRLKDGWETLERTIKRLGIKNG